MEKLFILAASNNYIDNLLKDLKSISVSCELMYSLFELRKKAEQEKPSLILVADNLKEKKIDTLIPSFLNNEITESIPIIGLTTSENHIKSTKAFFENGVVDVIHLPAEIEETELRLHLREREASLKNTLTPNEYFFSEAQEKEQGKRSGYFHFYVHRRIRVGEIAIKDGKVVSATYSKLIKEDAFLQLTCNPLLSFRFEDTKNVKTGKIETTITSMLLEASKLRDEIKRQENIFEDEIRCLVIDNSRIARLLASRVLKNLKIESKVLGANEFKIRLLTQFTPSFLILDFETSESILDMIWQVGHTSEDIPIIIYCDEDVKDINFSRIGKHSVEFVVHKDELPKNMQGFLEELFDFKPEKK